jgi:GNAT superfamily N-acetyltransferase
MIEFREITQGEERAVCDVIIKTFNDFIAPTYSSEGIESFFKYINIESLPQLFMEGYPVFTAVVAVINNQIVGVISFRVRDKECHITLLFVNGQYHRRGITKGLLNFMLDICKYHNANLSEITVNSSPYAVPIYEKLGFQQTSSEQIIDGIRFTPMALCLREVKSWI